jgi:hypothetical protein
MVVHPNVQVNKTAYPEDAGPRANVQNIYIWADDVRDTHEEHDETLDSVFREEGRWLALILAAAMSSSKILKAYHT